MDRELLKKRLGLRLKELRLAKGLKQEDLEGLGFSYRYYGKLERGMVNPTLETLGRLSEIFEITLSQLFLFMESSGVASDDREAVALKVGEVLKGDKAKVKKLRIFLEQIL
jgi:transcriptional regulator with XRE-family HTH domain